MKLSRLASVATVVAWLGCDGATKTGSLTALTDGNDRAKHAAYVEQPNDRQWTIVCKPRLQVQEDQTTHLVDPEGNLFSPMEFWLLLEDDGEPIRFLLDRWPQGSVQGTSGLSQLHEDREYEFTLELQDDSSVDLMRVAVGKVILFEGRVRRGEAR